LFLGEELTWSKGLGGLLIVAGPGKTEKR